MVTSKTPLGRCLDADRAGLTSSVEPELDARAIPPSIRLAAVFGVLDSLPAGGTVIVVAPHDPVPLVACVAERYDGAVSVDYLERGPDAWRVRFTRAP